MIELSKMALQIALSAAAGHYDNKEPFWGELNCQSFSLCSTQRSHVHSTESSAASAAVCVCVSAELLCIIKDFLALEDTLYYVIS